MPALRSSGASSFRTPSRLAEVLAPISTSEGAANRVERVDHVVELGAGCLAAADLDRLARGPHGEVPHAARLISLGAP